MTLKQLKEIIDPLPPYSIILIDSEDLNDVETVNVEYKNSGTVEIILCNKE